MSNGDRIRAWRTAKGWTLTHLAEELGTSKAYLSQVETGARPASPSLRSKLEVLGLALAAEEVRKVIVRTANDVTVPLYRTSVRAGTGAPIFEEDVEQFNVSEHYRNTVVYEVSGDSMVGAGIEEGDRVIARSGHRFRNRDIIICSYNDQLMVKGAVVKDDGVWLVSFNVHVHPFPLEDTDQFECLGVVIEVIKRPRRDVWSQVDTSTLRRG